MKSSDDLERRLAGFGGGWAFRGMSIATWPLKTSLERVAVGPVVEAERYLLTAFQRRAHHYLTDLPDVGEGLEWLALMQHHGAPTRLLDWTKSPYVALYFALERATDAPHCAVWALDLDWCKREALRLITATPGPPLLPDDSLGKPDVFSRIFLEQGLRLVAPLQPFRMNERLTVQQGLFICPGSLHHSFEDNLLAFPQRDTRRHVQRLLVPTALRIEVLHRLNKMNINRATLFPGIDGFAQSLLTNVQIATSTGRMSREVQKLSTYTDWGFL